MKHLETINAEGWEELLGNSDRILETVLQSSFPTVTLGNAPNQYAA